MDGKRSMTGLKALVIYSTKKLLLNRRWAIVVLMALLVGAVMGYAATQEVDRLDEGSDLLGVLILGFFMPVLALVYGGSMIRNEIDDRSITPVITAPLDRSVSYMGYYLALVAVLVPMVLALNLVGWSCFFLSAGVDGLAVSMLVSYSIVLAIGGAVYASLFLALGVLLKQPIYLGLFYVFIWEGLVGSLPGAVGEYTIGHQLGVIASSMIEFGRITFVSGSVSVSSIALVWVLGASLLVGALAFRRREVP